MKAIVLILFVALIAPPATARDDLYVKLGERPGIEAIVQRTADLAFADARTAEQFKHSNKERLVRLITDQICELTGGACDYRGVNMKKAHIKLGITMAEFNAFVESLQQAMREAGISHRTQNRLVALLAPMMHDIVER